MYLLYNAYSRKSVRKYYGVTQHVFVNTLKRFFSLLFFSLSFSLFVSISANAQIPDGPAFVRDTHLIENGEFTRPMQPAVHTSRDGRIALRAEAVLSFNLFAPEKLDQPFSVSEPGIDNVYANTVSINQSVFRRTEGVGAFRHIALCEAPPSQSNPINPKVCNGNDDCYDLTVIAATRPSSNNIRFVGIDVRVRVENPKTPQARIAEITHETPVLGSTFPFIDFFETTTPADGRLIVGRTAGSTVRWVDEDGDNRSSGIDSVYLVNDNPDAFEPCDVRQFDKVYPLSYAPYDATINNRYGFAMHPFRAPDGTVYPDATNIGSYPWIDRDADNVSMTTVRGRLFTSSSSIFPARCPDQVISDFGSCLSDRESDINSARLQGRNIMGLWTQGKSVIMDNLINNMDFGLGVADRRHRDVMLYNPSSDHDGWVRVAGGRRGSGAGGPRPRGSGNANFLDSLEHRFYMFDNMKPVTPSDVPWIMSKGVVADEVLFDDYNNPDSFINSSMAPLYSSQFSIRGLVNNATALPDRWSIPTLARVSDGRGRIERVANGGITGRGLWLNDDTSVRYGIPDNGGKIDGTPWYVSLFFDRRFEGGASQSRNLITFSDGSSLRVRGDGGLQFLDTRGRLVKNMSVNGATQNRARNNGKGWAHVGLDIAQGNRGMRVYYNGFYLDRVDADEPLFRMTEGNLYVGANPTNPNDGFRGWIDDFKVFAQGVNPEVACNHAKGTLIGTPEGSGWNQLARTYPAGHFRIRQMVQAAGEPTNEHYACYHDYRGDYRAHMANIPANHRSIREAINFPEGPLHYGAPRPDSSDNSFCLSCHTDDGRLGMNTSALTLNTRLNAEDDPRRQPTQPDAKVSGFIPANWLGQGKPRNAIRTGLDGVDIDQWLLAAAEIPNRAPSVSFADPSSNDVVDEGDDLYVRVNASDSDGRIANVRLFLVDGDGERSGLRTERQAPYEWGAEGQSDPLIENLSAGNYQLIAVATDDDGATSESSTRFSVGGSGGLATFVIGSDQTISRWNGSSFERFGTPGGRLVRIDVGENGRPWGINVNNDVYEWNGSRWLRRTSDGQDIAVGGGNVFLTRTDDTIWRWNGSSFEQFGTRGGRLQRIDVGEDGVLWGINVNNDVYQWNGSRWLRHASDGQDIAVGGGNVFLTRTDDSIWRWNGSSFEQFGSSRSRLQNIDVGEDGVLWGINVNGMSYFWNGSRFINVGDNALEIGR